MAASCARLSAALATRPAALPVTRRSPLPLPPAVASVPNNKGVRHSDTPVCSTPSLAVFTLEARTGDDQREGREEEGWSDRRKGPP
eukprot:scaffold124949_cov26-Tisochrysis_lutea.AAC.1